jgi:hypothetical protein
VHSINAAHGPLVIITDRDPSALATRDQSLDDCSYLALQQKWIFATIDLSLFLGIYVLGDCRHRKPCSFRADAVIFAWRCPALDCTLCRSLH